MISDETGSLYVVNMSLEKTLVKYEIFLGSRISKIYFVNEMRKLLCVTDTSVKVFRVIRSLKAPIFNDGHQGKVLATIAIDPDTILKKASRDSPRLISAGVDNTIRVWDISGLCSADKADLDRDVID